MFELELQTIELADVDHWRLGRDAEDILWLAFDCAGTTTNTLSSIVLTQLEQALNVAGGERGRGLVIYSAKPNGFAAGADISEFDQMTDADETAQRLDEVHRLFARLEQWSTPSVALVHGFCLGGGLELALACRHIVATSDVPTRLGFPEVLLGIHPGFGGTVRAIRDCGASKAMDLILTGRSIEARRAAKMGLIDRAVPERHILTAARYFAAARYPKRQAGRLQQLEQSFLARPVLAAIMRRQVAKQAREQHYPAPYAAIRLFQDHAGDFDSMYRAEAKSIGQLLTTATSRNLVRVFQLQERLKAFGRNDDWQPQRVHVIGAGTMGGDIAAWCAMRGLEVTLNDRAPEYYGGAVKRAHKLFKRRIRDPYLRQQAHDRLQLDFNGDGVQHADVIIEAIIEHRDIKRELFRELEQQASPEAVLATNTSSIPLAEIAEALEQPSRLVGIHFFNPVAQMQLVEIISSETTDAAVAAKAAAFTTVIDRLPLPVRSAPGFLVNRVLSPYLQEAMTLLEEGVPASIIDAAARDFGMPMGPIELADTVGLDICLHVGNILSAAFGGEAPAILKRQVEQKRLGKKTDAGFYDYRKGKPVVPRRQNYDSDTSDIRDRLVLRLVNEAVNCLADEVVEDADLVDVGMVFGTGFAPFRGGPMHYAKHREWPAVYQRLLELEARYGERFRPVDGWTALLGD